MSKFWQNWFSAFSIMVVLFGLLLAAGAFPATDGPLNALLTLFGQPLPADIDAHHRFAFGLMGAVSMGWGLTYFATFKALLALEPAKAAPIWRMVTWAIIAWYVIDSAISIATGFWMNAVSNTGLLAFYLIGLFKSGALKG